MRIVRQRALLAVLASLALAACTTETQPPAAVGSPAPAYSATALTGDSVSLAKLRGKVVLLNVWATWCIPCRKEMPELQALHEQNEARGLEVVGVSIDAPGDDNGVRDFLHDYGITYTILRDPVDRISDGFAIIGVPASFLIDRQGKIAWKHLGPFTRTDSALVRALAAAL
jgi:peroxiredoxin